MAGWGEALQILGGAGAGGFKAAGDVAEEEVKGIRTDMLQAALDKRADNLKRWESEEAIKERKFKTGESKLSRESSEKEGRLGRESTERIAKLKADEPGTFEEKYNFLVKIYGKDKAESLIESSLEKSESGAVAKSKIDALSKAYELRDTGAPLEDINQVLKAGGVEEWVVKKIIKKEKGWFGTKDVEEEVYGPPEKKGLLGGTVKEGVEESATKKTSLDELLSMVGDQPTVTQKPGLVAPKEKLPTEEEFGGILRKSKTYQTGIGFKPEEFKPGAMQTIVGKVKDWTSQTIPEGRRKMGRTDLENAIEISGFGKTYDEVRDMAANLKKRYPKLSEEQLIELVKKIAAGE